MAEKTNRPCDDHVVVAHMIHGTTTKTGQSNARSQGEKRQIDESVLLRL